MSDHFNQLTPAEAERLALLAEELCEAGQAINKILRHGYESYNPHEVNGMSNRAKLQHECGHVHAALWLMAETGDIDEAAMEAEAELKFSRVLQWMHHQEPAE